MEATTFSAAIEAHLELQRRNSRLEQAMPIAGYREPGTDARVDSPWAPTLGSGGADADAPTEATIRTAPWDDPDSWWNTTDPLAGWGDAGSAPTGSV